MKSCNFCYKCVGENFFELGLFWRIWGEIFLGVGFLSCEFVLEKNLYIYNKVGFGLKTRNLSF